MGDLATQANANTIYRLYLWTAYVSLKLMPSEYVQSRTGEALIALITAALRGQDMSLFMTVWV